MALQTSGQISLNDVNVELGNSGTAQIDMNSAAVRGLFGVASGEIGMDDGYGAANAFALTLSSSTQEANLSTLATAAGWDGSSAVEVTIASGVYVWSDNVSVAGLLVNIANCTVTNSGYIIGRGGNGGNGGLVSGYNGGPAISVTASNVTISNEAGAYIAGGGGGGGGDGWYLGGGGGGAGGGSSNGGGAGGAIGAAGADGYAGTGGGAGGAGGGYGANAYGSFTARAGGGGGRILPGVGGTGPNFGGGYGANGGSAGQAGDDSYYEAGGGGGWGASGGRASTYNSNSNGGAGGAAISNTSSYTLTNNGTVYGAT